jgi:nucleoside-diphosphate-sugar epimerase
MSAPASDKVALIIGVTGGIGGAAALALQRHGWRVRALTRDRARATQRFARLEPVGWRQVEWCQGDAMDRAAMIAAAKDAQLILHGANPPRYRNWRGLALPMLEHAIDAAKASGARLVLPGNVYNFAPDIGELVAETAGQRPATRKGAIRVEMEQMVARAADQGVRSLVLRAGDYFGPDAPSSWFQNALVRPGHPVRRVTYPGPLEIGHSWAYLPDLAEALALLAERDAMLAPVETMHFAGHVLADGHEMVRAIARAAGLAPLPAGTLPWRLIAMLAPIVPLFRELSELRYLWLRPLHLDNSKLVRLIGPEPHTPLEDAVQRTLIGLGCIEAKTTAESRATQAYST